MILALIALLIFISYVDMKTKIIKDGVTLFGILIALNYQLFFGDIRAAVLGITAGIGTVWISNQLRKSQLGGGDAKTMALIGCCTNWKVAIATLLVAQIIAIPFRQRGRKGTIAYAPLLTSAFILVEIWQTAILYLKI